MDWRVSLSLSYAMTLILPLTFVALLVAGKRIEEESGGLRSTFPIEDEHWTLDMEHCNVQCPML